jgi:hypothetical protein
MSLLSPVDIGITLIFDGLKEQRWVNISCAGVVLDFVLLRELLLVVLKDTAANTAATATISSHVVVSRRMRRAVVSRRMRRAVCSRRRRAVVPGRRKWIEDQVLAIIVHTHQNLQSFMNPAENWKKRSWTLAYLFVVFRSSSLAGSPSKISLGRSLRGQALGEVSRVAKCSAPPPFSHQSTIYWKYPLSKVYDSEMKSNTRPKEEIQTPPSRRMCAPLEATSACSGLDIPRLMYI